MIRQRCAIYTRKSTEEGLEQEFNSLDAQREACAAYVLSQKHEGWAELTDRYDDGGFSGGSMQRPGLKQLLEDVRAGRVDVIVVYKVDRLTRSLTDFAKMVDSFDAAGVSFVSVTQAFNTTNSMGRLTLNVLLSFAQFEREVTAERIRDKVAASKRKGMWMGGAVPMGYDIRDKALVVNPIEAAAIRTIFKTYLASGSVRLLSNRLSAMGIVSKRRVDRHGRVTGGKAFSRGALYNILRNSIYIGKTRHKDMLHDGLHAAIVEDDVWHAAQDLLAQHGGKEIDGQRRPAKRFLDSLLFDAHGRPMSTTYASKSIMRNGAKRTKRYWYYVSKSDGLNDAGKRQRLPASEIEGVVLKAVQDRLANQSWLVDALRERTADASLIATVLNAASRLPDNYATPKDSTEINLASVVQRVDLAADAISITLSVQNLLPKITMNDDLNLSFEIPFTSHQKSRAKPIVIITSEKIACPDADLINLVADAKRWMAELLDGRAASVQYITDRETLRSGAVSRILPLAFLAPDIATAILSGHQPASLSAKTLRDLKDLPMDWSQQRCILGFASI